MRMNRHRKAELADPRRPVWLPRGEPVGEQGSHPLGAMERFIKKIPERWKVQFPAEGIQRLSRRFPKSISTIAKKTRFTHRGDRVSHASSSMKTGHS